MKSPIFVPVHPHIVCGKVIGIVQDSLPMNVFSVDIPLKGSQSHSNMRSKVTVNVKESDFLELFAKIFKKKLVAQRCQ
jgi:hypothetical protein